MPRVLGFIRDQYTPLPVPHVATSISNATYIVTGANTGLGFECAKHLVRMGAGRIIIGVRTRQKGEAALAAIRNETGRQFIGEAWEIDLTSLDSVEAFSKRVLQLDRVDGLVCNAGVVMSRFELIEGIETSLVVNVVSTMLLVLRAMPRLQESAQKFGIQTSIVVVTSNSAFESNMKSIIKECEGNVFEGLSVEKDFNIMTQ